MRLAHMFSHQTHYANSGQSALDIFITLHIFTQEPITEQEIHLSERVLIKHGMQLYLIQTLTLTSIYKTNMPLTQPLTDKMFHNF